MKKQLKKHIIDSTAVATVTNPVMAGLEIFVAGMSNDVSINARVLGTALTFAGLGSLYSKGRDLSKKIFKITEKTSEKIKQIHDTAYGVAYLLAITPPFYYAAGSRDLKEIAAGTALAAATGILGGGLAGYTVDMYNDLTGIKESERLPKIIKKQNSAIKKGLAALVTAASVGIMAGFYSLR